MMIEKFREGAWITALITLICIGVCFLIRKHYYRVALKIKEIDRAFENLPATAMHPEFIFDASKSTAVILVGGHSGLGIHILLNIFRHFPGAFKNVVFLTVGVVTSDFFKGGHHVEALSKKTEETLNHYIDFSRKAGIPAKAEFKIGAEVVEAASELCVEVSKKYPHSVFFAGELVFEKPQWYHRILHNETAYAILRRIRFAGLPMVILPIRITS